jgi:general secretion pathway protein D
MAMRWGGLVAVAAALSCVALAADRPTSTTSLSCMQANPGNPGCAPSHDDLKKAKGAFSRALHLEKEKHFDEAYREFDTAARLVPNNLSYQTALAITREELVSQHIKQGNSDLEDGLAVQAQAEFDSAVGLDPDNKFAQQQLQTSLGEWAPEKNSAVKIVKSSGLIEVAPKPGHNAFQLRGDSRTVLTQVAQTYGITAEIDASVESRRVRFYIDDVDFYTAMRAVCEITGSFWTPVSEKQILLVKNTQENHRLYDRMAMRVFDVGFASTAPQMQEMVNLMRVIFEIRFVTVAPASNRLTVRAPTAILDAATRFLESFDRARPQVMLDVQVFEVDRQLATDIGVHIPDTFNLFNIPAAAFAGLGGLGGQNIQSLVNQLIASGGINQANSSALSGLLAQLQGQQGQQGGLSSLFSNPVATFGGGLTLMGLTLDMLTPTLSLNESMVKMLDHATLRAGQGEDANFLMGQRYPVINASFAPIYNTSAISQVLQNGSFQAPIPSFTYEDLGLKIKAKPVITPNYKVNLQLEMELRSLAGQSLNGVPVIANRAMKSSINLENGEPAVVASSISSTEMKIITGIPGISSIPGLNQLASARNNSEDREELLVVITPHILNLEPQQSSEVWLAP